MQLKSRYHEAPDMAAAMEMCYAKGWTDGLPVVPPTEERIADMLAAVNLEPDRQVTFIENRQVSVTAEKLRLTQCLPAANPNTCRSSSRRSKRSAIRSTATTVRPPAPAARRC